MSLLFKPGEPQTLSLNENTPQHRVYKLATPTTIGRTRFRRMIAEAGGRQHGTVPLLKALKASVDKVFQGGEVEIRNALGSAVEAQIARILAFWDDVSNGKYDALERGEADAALREDFRTRQLAIVEGANALANTQRIILDADPAYAAMVADDQSFPAIRGTVAAQLLLVAWEGPDFAAQPFKGADGLLAEECLAQIPESDLPALGAKAEEMMALDKAQKKASVSPAPGASAGGTSST